MSMEKEGMHCGHHGSIKMGILLALFGLVFLAGALDVIDSKTVAMLWPSVIILAGLVKILKGLSAGNCSCSTTKGKK